MSRLLTNLAGLGDGASSTEFLLREKRSFMNRLLWISLLFASATLGWADPLPTLQLVPSEQIVNAGDTVTLDLNIVGLGSPGSMEVGSFDSFIGFNPVLLSPAGATFTLLLGDPNLLEAITAFSTGSYWAEAVDVSLLSVSDLDAMQPSTFTLATYSFVALQSGQVDFVYLGGPVDNGYGDLIAGTKELVPEPSSIVLVLSGVVGGGWRRLRRCGSLGIKLLICVLVLGFTLVRPNPAAAQGCASDKAKETGKTDSTKC